LFAGGGGELGGVESGAEFAEFVGGFLLAFAEFFFDGFFIVVSYNIVFIQQNSLFIPLLYPPISHFIQF
jgi:hypothetical protein